MSFRRAVGAVVCLSPALLLFVSFGTGVARPAESDVRSVLFMCAALAVGAINFYGSFGAPRLYRKRNGSMAGYRHTSGLPLVGTGLVVIGGLVGLGDWVAAVLGLIALAIDTGGSVWFLVATWRDASFWDG